MRRPFLALLLVLGVILGYGSGVAHLVAHHHDGGCPRAEAPATP